METEALRSGRAALSAAAMAEWQEHVENVLRGIAHSLNNRAAAVSAVLELASDANGDVASPLTILRSELARFGELSAVVRSIGVHRLSAEAFPTQDAVADAATVLKLHAARQEGVVVLDAGTAPPVRVPRWMFVHALVALGASVPSDARQARVAVSGEGDWVVARVEGEGLEAQRTTACVTELARLMGGDPLDDGNGFRVPTLAALRRREAL